MEDDGPDETQRQLWVAVHDLIAANVHQFDLRKKKIEQIFTKNVFLIKLDFFIELNC